MSIYGLIYLIFSVILVAYTVKNRLDLLSIATICFIVYSMYCIQGIGIAGFYRPKLCSKLYYLIYVQMFIILIFSIIVRGKEKHKILQNSFCIKYKPQITENKYSNRLLDLSFYIYTAIMFMFAFVNIAKIGFSGFSAGKTTVWEEANILYIISLYGSYPSFAYGLHNKKKWIWIPSLFIELTIFFAGARAFVATLIIIFLCEKGYSLWKNKKSCFKIYVLGAVAIVFLLIYRMVDVAIMNGDLSAAIRLLQNPSVWKSALEFNEPRVIIANYDYVLTSGIRLPISDIIYRFVDFIPGLTHILPIKLCYPEYFSDWLFYEVHASAGVGGSIWGESYAMFGTVGVFVFTLLWLWVVSMSDKHLSYYKEYSYFIVSLGLYLSWYINRLDFNRVGQVTKITFMCFLMWGVIYVLIGGKIKIFNRTICVIRY